jgi:hypothetical protein
MNEENQQPVENTTQPAAPQLSIQDLQNLRAVIDLAVRRGAFGASEVSSVGQVFDRLNAFLTAVAPQTDSSTNQQ